MVSSTYYSLIEDEGEGEVAVFSAKRWDRRSSWALIESSNPCHDAQVVGSYRVLNPLRLIVLTAKPEDYTTAPKHLQEEILILIVSENFSEHVFFVSMQEPSLPSIAYWLYNNQLH